MQFKAAGQAIQVERTGLKTKPVAQPAGLQAPFELHQLHPYGHGKHELCYK